MDIRAGATVRAANGRAFGIVEGILVNPANSEMAGLLITKGAGGAAVIPIDMVEDATGTAVALRGTWEELDALPWSAEHYYGHVPPGWQPAPGFGASGVIDQAPPDHGPNEADVADVRVGGHADVICEDGPIGTVSRLLVDDYTGEITGVVISSGQYLDHDVQVPFGWVQSMDDGRLHLSCRRNAVRDFPEASPE